MTYNKSIVCIQSDKLLLLLNILKVFLYAKSNLILVFVQR